MTSLKHQCLMDFSNPKKPEDLSRMPPTSLELKHSVVDLGFQGYEKKGLTDSPSAQIFDGKFNGKLKLHCSIKFKKNNYYKIILQLIKG